jgi:hypothetical protein
MVARRGEDWRPANSNAGGLRAAAHDVYDGQAMKPSLCFPFWQSRLCAVLPLKSGINTLCLQIFRFSLA